MLDAAYAFDDGDHLARFFESDASTELLEGFADETGVHTLGAWSAGMRHFTANEPIREPGDLDGLRMRFPNSPQFLMNAEALGADATEVAYEELFLALQQGTVDGQENPIVNIDAISLEEVQDYISLSSHQANSNLVIIGEVWDELSTEQQDALQAAVDAAVEQVPGCVDEDEQKTLAEWEESGAHRDRRRRRRRGVPHARPTPTCGRTSTRSSSRSTRGSGAPRSDGGGGGSDLPGAGRRRRAGGDPDPRARLRGPPRAGPELPPPRVGRGGGGRGGGRRASSGCGTSGSAPSST